MACSCLLFQIVFITVAGSSIASTNDSQFLPEVCLENECFLRARHQLHDLLLLGSSALSPSLSVKGQCAYCHSTLVVVRQLARANKQVALDCLAHLLCITVLRNQWSPHVCLQTYRMYKEDVLTVLMSSDRSAKQLCAEIMPECGKNEHIRWNLSIPDWPAVNRPSDPTSANGQPNEPRSVLRILHVTDIHIQPDYRPGADAFCNEPVCCCFKNATDPSREAGYFGTYAACDIPSWTADAILKRIADTYKIDSVYYTGDTPSHQIWNQNLEGNIGASQQVISMLERHFVRPYNIPVYFSVGNHDIAPCNMFSIDANSQSSRHFFGSLVDSWVRLGNLDSSSRRTIQEGGFYSTRLFPGVRLISLNTNYGSAANYWLQLNETDPKAQLRWLIDELLSAELHGEHVHIIAHHCPSVNLLSWSANFANIVQRFNKSIKALMFGHAHDDYFTIFGSFLDPYAVGILSPSLTTYLNHKPAFRILNVDASDGTLLDYETFVIDLDKSNSRGSLVVEREYSMKEFFQMPDLSPSCYAKLISRLIAEPNGDLMDAFIRIVFKPASFRRCDTKCRRKIIDLLLKYRPDIPNLF